MKAFLVFEIHELLEVLLAHIVGFLDPLYVCFCDIAAHFA